MRVDCPHCGKFFFPPEGERIEDLLVQEKEKQLEVKKRLTLLLNRMGSDHWDWNKELERILKC